MVIDDILNPFFPELIAGVMSAAEQRSWTVLISTVQNDHGREPELLRSLAGQVDALIGYLYERDAGIAEAIEGLPMVVMGRPAQHPAFGVVDVDVRPGVQAAVDHLLAQGHQRIGMIDCPTACDPLRRQVLLEATAAQGLPIPAEAIVETEQSQAGGEEALARLLKAAPGLTAVLAFNDVVALGAYRTARSLGLTIPGDLALVGFDGLSLGEILDPPLTTINIDKRRMGELAVAQAECLLNGEHPPPATVTTDLLVRASTGSPSAGASG
nr:substrate-binding domain-containing protein [Kineosporia rhizophila]